MKPTCQSNKTPGWYIAATSTLWLVLGTVAICLGAAVAGEARNAATEALDQLTLSVTRAEQALRTRPF
jgi:hypothetical protein